MTEAPRSTTANKLVNCSSTFLMTGGRLAARSSFGPSATSRDAAVAAVSPWAELSNASKTSAGARAEMPPEVAGRGGRSGPCGTAAGAGASVVTSAGRDNGKCRAERTLPNSA
jgi:hypothetical protein